MSFARSSLYRKRITSGASILSTRASFGEVYHTCPMQISGPRTSSGLWVSICVTTPCKHLTQRTLSPFLNVQWSALIVEAQHCAHCADGKPKANAVAKAVLVFSAGTAIIIQSVPCSHTQYNTISAKTLNRQVLQAKIRNTAFYT